MAVRRAAAGRGRRRRPGGDRAAARAAHGFEDDDTARPCGVHLLEVRHLVLAGGIADRRVYRVPAAGRGESESDGQ